MIAFRSTRLLGVSIALGVLALLPACSKDGASDHPAADTAAVATSASPSTMTDTAAQAGATSAAVTSNVPDDQLPVIVADNAHQTMDTPGNPNIPHYKIPASEGFVLDVSHVTFKKPYNGVEVLFEQGGGYIVQWGKDSSRVVVRPSMFKPLQMSSRDTRFSKGHNFQIVVGNAGKPNELGFPGSFDPSWVANVDVE